MFFLYRELPPEADFFSRFGVRFERKPIENRVSDVKNPENFRLRRAVDDNSEYTHISNTGIAPRKIDTIPGGGKNSPFSHYFYLQFVNIILVKHTYHLEKISEHKSS